MSEATTTRKVLNLLWSERYGYPFDDWVADRRETGAAWRQIEREVRHMVGIDISYATLSIWFPELRDSARGAA